MKQLLFIIISISILGCNSSNSKDGELKHKKNSKIETIKIDKEPVIENECECIDFAFSQKGERPLLTHKIGTSEIIVCGYRGEYDDDIILGERLLDSSFYASGFEVFICSGSDVQQMFADGEYYLDLIKPKPEELEVVRLMRMPSDKSLKYKWTEVLSIRLFEQNGVIKTDTSFVLPIDKFDNDFLEYFNSEIERVQNDSSEILKYPDYLIDYNFIQAIKEPKEYSEKLKSIGPFDGYLGPVYRDVLMYYEVFENDNFN